ncbi:MULTISPECIES: hypothetical protein [unclassified Nostoc]|uniref:hypothetical protein n=1 Tax=unclassified Nostoc TaxID=2593658 RepID=UPI001D7846CE|nr:MULTISPECIES: hypothetical protein [unclassified Nostoc]MBN3877460.1 hypothetical protein [Nostoc sp. JL23]MBN3893571.1 hypothetical protein [Nostoc sp. JL31]
MLTDEAVALFLVVVALVSVKAELLTPPVAEAFATACAKLVYLTGLMGLITIITGLLLPPPIISSEVFSK